MRAYKKCAADDDKHATVLVGLRVDGRNLVLNTAEGQLLCLHDRISIPSCNLDRVVRLVVMAYLQLADDVSGAKEGRSLKGEHGVIALGGCVSLVCPLPLLKHVQFCNLTYVERRKLRTVGVEGLVVELGELLLM